MEERSQLTRQILIDEFLRATYGKTVSFATATDIVTTLGFLNPRTLAGFLLQQRQTARQVWNGNSEFFRQWPGGSLDILAFAVTWMQIVEENERHKMSTE